MATENPKLEIFFLPAVMARGHLIPMVDTARIFASLGVKATILTTAANAKLFEKTAERDRSLGLDVQFHTLKLPTAEVGLPEGIENNLAIFSSEMKDKLDEALGKMQGPIQQLIEERRPDCIISDVFYPWTADVGLQLGIPRIFFQVTGLFPFCCQEILQHQAPQEKVDSDTATFTMPGLPNPNNNIEFTRLKIPFYFNKRTALAPYMEIAAKAQRDSYGVMFNSYYDLESDYAEYFKKETSKRLWLVGPVYLFNKNEEEKVDRGEKSSVAGSIVLNWLEAKPLKSVLYVSFGSQVHMAAEQFLELAHGLEGSGHSFIWVARDMSLHVTDKGERRNNERVFPEGFEERVTKTGQGLIVKSWAPQLLILEHPAVGGFMTHCGWNSAVEGLGAGLPVITWPLETEQFFIESLLTDVLKTGIRVGNEEWMYWAWEQKVTVSRDKVEKAVKRLMGGGEEVEEMRRRARELGEKARKAVAPGGSSHADAVALINELKSRRSDCGNEF